MPNISPTNTLHIDIDMHPLANLYTALGSPPISPVISNTKRRPSTNHVVANSYLHPDSRVLAVPTPYFISPPPSASVSLAPSLENSPVNPVTPLSLSITTPLPVPSSLQPTQHHTQPKLPLPIPNFVHLDEIDSLTRERKGDIPSLNHLLSIGDGRVLCLAADKRFVYAGSQSRKNEITVFSRSSLQPMYRLIGHGGSVLALMVIEKKSWLISSSSAGDIRIWSTKTLQPLFIIRPIDDTSGDIYSLAWDDRSGGTLYFGAQDTSIGWVNFCDANLTRPRKPSSPSVVTSVPTSKSNGNISSSEGDHSDASTSSARPERSGRNKPHRFFDAVPDRRQQGSSTPTGTVTPRTPCGSSKAFPQKDYFSSSSDFPHSVSESEMDVKEIAVDVTSMIGAAHFGYVYAMEMVTRADGSRWLVSGSGDSDVKIWNTTSGGGLNLLKTFTNLSGAVLSLAVRDDTLLFAGLQDGEIVIWDLETFACIRTVNIHEADVMTMSVLGSDVYTAGADGRVLRIDAGFDCSAAFGAHNGIVLGSCVVEEVRGERWELITAGNDSFVKIWSIDLPRTPSHDADVDVEGEGDVMLYALSKLVAVPTVSDEAHRESCRQGAHLLKKILSQLGAQSEVLSGEQGRNPLVLATFSGTNEHKPRKRILFYGHYDVQPAAEAEWETNPWELSGRNGYLYGRGVSDNKGPILAVACAAASLRQRRELDVDLVMLIEGEEEAGSRGFASTVRKNRAAIGDIDAVLLSNSTWIGEDDPCVVFGMRGVVYANLSVSSTGDDAHSGVDGGAVAEPMFDMVRVLAAISDREGVKLPAFYDNVRPETKSEMLLLQQVAQASNKSLKELVKVWRQPSFSIANIVSSGATNKTVISKKVTADISMRLVPDQDLETIVNSLKTYCRETFEDLKSSNNFDITITHSASWWLTSLESPYFKALEKAIEDVWGVAPLKIREGGTVPTIFWLEQEFKAPCVHLPLGQASDAGHLANERMKLLNLRNGKRVVESFLSQLSSI